MASDFRISTGLPDHLKTQKVISRLGTGAMWHWICLCAYTAQNRPSGDLSGISVEDLELAAKWPDFRFKSGQYKGRSSKGVFIEVLVEVGFLDRQGDDICWHDWDKHQSWVSKEDSRRELARKAAQAKWDAKKLKLEALTTAHKVVAHAERIEEECGTDAERIAESKNGNAPFLSISLPSPSPTPSLKQAAKRGCRIPDDFAVTEDHRTFAREHGYVSPDSEIHKFRDYWSAKAGAGAVKVDWHATFRVWLSNAEKYRTRNGNGANQQITKTAARAKQNFDEGRRAAAEILGMDHCEANGAHEVPEECRDDGGSLQNLRKPSQRSEPATIEGRIR